MLTPFGLREVNKAEKFLRDKQAEHYQSINRVPTKPSTKVNVFEFIAGIVVSLLLVIKR